MLKTISLFLARLCMSLEFLWPGLAKIFDWQGSNLYTESREIPHIAVILIMAILIQSAGGLSLLFGYYTRQGAGLLVVSLAFEALLFHDFWNLQGIERLIQQIIFMKDLAVFGGLIYVLVHGPGPLSLDYRRAIPAVTVSLGPERGSR